MYQGIQSGRVVRDERNERLGIRVLCAVHPGGSGALGDAFLRHRPGPELGAHHLPGSLCRRNAYTAWKHDGFVSSQHLFRGPVYHSGMSAALGLDPPFSKRFLRVVSSAIGPSIGAPPAGVNRTRVAALLFRFLDSWPGNMTGLCAAMNSTLDRSERPRQVLYALRLLYASLGVGFLKVGIKAFALTKIHGADRLVFLTLVTFVIMALFFALIGMGKNWARILFLVSFLVGIPFWPGNMADAFRFSTFSGVLYIVQAGLQLWALILLFQSDSSAWFRRSSARRAAALTDG